MSRLLRRALLVLAMASALALTWRIAGRVLGRSRLRFPYLSGTLAAADYQALAARPGWSASSITVAPNVELRGLVRRPRAANAPWLLFYPGNDATQLRRGQAFLSELSGERDYGLAVYAYRGYDSSGGTPRLDDLARDASEIYQQLCKAEGLTPARVQVIGFSIGGHLATRAAAAAARAGSAPASLSLLASVDDIVMFRRSLWEKLDPGDDYQTRPFLNDVRAPVLVIQGTADEALHGPAQGRAISAALGSRARYVELDGVGHEALLTNEAALSELRAFVAAQSPK